MATARYYDESKDDGTQAIYGVPKGPISEEQYKALPKWVQAQVDASPMYRKTNPSPEPRSATEEDGQKAANKPGKTSAGMEG